MNMSMNGMKKRNKTQRTLLTASKMLLCGVLASACTQSVVEVDEPSETANVPIRISSISTGTRSDETSTTDVPRFVAWTEADFNDEKNMTPIKGINDSVLIAPPFFYLDATDAIDAYATVPFNTWYYYPQNNSSIYAAGYYPSSDFTDVGTEPGQHLKYTAEIGKGDVMVSAKTLEGSKKDPIDNQQMEFKHILTKITLYAKLHENMYKYISNVSLQISSKYAPMLEGLYASYDKREEQIYQPYAWKPTNGESDSIWKFETKEILSRVHPTEMVTLYLLPQTTIASLKDVTLKYSYSDTGDFETVGAYTNGEWTKDITFTDSEGKKIELTAGDSYEITFTFYKSEIEIKGRPVDWDDGGTITIPIYPNSENYITPTTNETNE